MVKHINIKTHTPQWYEFRQNGIGGSEISVVMGSMLKLRMNEYKSGMKLWAEKCGYIQSDTRDNEPMFHGRMLEQYIADLWQYYDGKDYIDNYKNENKLRTCYAQDGYFVNDNYPHLFASVDRFIDKDQSTLDGELLKNEGILECKTISTMAASAWEDGIPIGYLAQIQQYLLILELNYAELAILEGGNKFYVMSVPRSEKLCETIVETSKLFWYDYVLPAKEIVKKIQENPSDHLKYESELMILQPDADSTDDCTLFLKERYRKEKDNITGSSEIFEIALKEKKVSEVINALEERKNLYRNELLKYFTELKVQVINFDKGNIKMSEKNKRSMLPSLRNNVKVIIDVQPFIDLL